MRFIGRLIGLAWLGLIATAIIGAIAAVSAKRRMVTVDEPEANQISLGAVFEPISFRSTAAAFRGGSIECWYGGGVIDLREATLDPAGAHLEVKVVFGGGQLVVPEDWNVTSGVIGIGGIGDSRPKVARRPDAPSLTISGTVLFGGFGVASQVSEKGIRGLEQAKARLAERKQHASATPSATPTTPTEPVGATGPEVVATA